MKSATLPPLRVEPELREAVELVLREGETLSAFVEAAVRERVERREHEAAFLARGIAAGKAADEAVSWIPASQVLKKLEKRVARAKRKR